MQDSVRYMHHGHRPCFSSWMSKEILTNIFISSKLKVPIQSHLHNNFQLCFWLQCPSVAANLRSYQREIILTKGDHRGRALMIGFFFPFLTTGLATTLFRYLGPCLPISYIRNFIHPIPYNRKMLSSNKE